MPTTNDSFLTWGTTAAAEWMRIWLSMFHLAPDELTQPILPGWTFNINSNNSSAPQTEADVVAKHSYGRQIGRMADAVEALVTESHGTTPTNKDYSDFLKMKREIDELKEEGAKKRVERIKGDLDLLKSKDKAEYRRLVEELRELLCTLERG